MKLFSMLALTITLASLILAVRYLTPLGTWITNWTHQFSRGNIKLESRHVTLPRQTRLWRPFAANSAKRRDGQKAGFLKKKLLGWVFLGFIGLFWVLLGFFGFYWVLLILALPITGFYWVLLGFIGFFRVLERVFGCFWFLPFWAIFDFSPIHYQVLAVLWCFIRFYWVFSLFLNDFGAILKKNQKNPFLVVFFDWAFLGFFGRVFLGWVFLAIPA